MADDRPLDTQAFRLELTVPCDDRFRPLLSVLCERMVRHVGYSQTEAAEVAAAVVHATDGVLVHSECPAYKDLDVTIATSESEIEFCVRYLRGQGEPSGDEPSIAHLLSKRSGDEAPLDAIHRVMGHVEFGQEDGVEFCTLTKSLPEEPSPRSRPEPSPES